jgi:RHS repeat-associated protein
MGRRIEMAAYDNSQSPVTVKTIRYYYDGQRAVLQAESRTDGLEERALVYGNYIDEVLAMRRKTATGGWVDFFYGHDHLYSPAVLFNPIGGVMERYEYDAYGAVRVMNIVYVPRAQSLYGNSITFTGRELDVLDNGSLNIMYYRARYYDPQTGRFMQRDPLGINPAGGQGNKFRAEMQYLDGANIFEYIRSSPLLASDPFGLAKKNISIDLMYYFYDWKKMWEDGDPARLPDNYYDYLYGRYSITVDEYCEDDIFPTATIDSSEKKMWHGRFGKGATGIIEIRNLLQWDFGGIDIDLFPAAPDMQLEVVPKTIPCSNGKGSATAYFYTVTLGYGVGFSVGKIDVEAFNVKAFATDYSVVACCGCVPDQAALNLAKQKWMLGNDEGCHLVYGNRCANE